MKIYKIALIHNIIAPYRIPLFNKLSDHPNIDLFVYYCSETHSDRKWDIIKERKFPSEILTGVTLGIGNLIYHINPLIIYNLIKGNYDAVIIGGYTDFTTQSAFLISKAIGIPVILWTEGIESAQSHIGKLIDPLNRYIISNMNAIIVPGTLSKEFCINQGAEEGKIFVAPNIVDNAEYASLASTIKENKYELKERLGIKEKKVLMFVGRFVEEKGIKYLIDSFKALSKDHPDLGLILVGDGPLLPKMTNYCKEINLKGVYFPGFVDELTKIRFYLISDIFVMPTLKDVWGLVINEAMLFGLPVITTKAAGAARDMVINGENGFVVDEANVDQLYLSINAILSDDQLLNRMREKSQEIIKVTFNVDKMMSGFISAIEYVGSDYK